ncbi:MAG: hypothetical protein ACRERD_17875, partial [Candidatus Binatia bacterium]
HRIYPLPFIVWPAVVASWVLSSLLGLLILVVPSGLGIAELSLTFLLSFYMPTSLAALAALGARALFTLLELVFAVISWVGQRTRQRITQ